MIVWHPSWLVKKRSNWPDGFSLDPAGCGGYGHLAFAIAGLNQRSPVKRVACLFGLLPEKAKTSHFVIC